jgi:DNA-binding NarL/FixJ family response regulator
MQPEPRIRVLLADDDPRFLAALGLALEPWREIEIVGLAQDGAEAIALFAETRPDVALIDLAMPRGDGVEVTAAVRQLDRDATVLIISGEEDGRTLVHCLDVGARGCLRKTRGLLDYAAVTIAATGAVKPGERT